MPNDSAVIDRLRPLGAIFRARDAIGHGISWRTSISSRLGSSHRGVPRALPAARGGRDRPDRLRRGLRPRPQGMVCLGSALAHWDLSDETPTRVDLAVPAGSHRRHIDYPPTSVHVFGASNFGLGRIEVAVGQDLGFRITDPKGRSSTVSDSDIALGSTSPSPVCAGTFAVRGPNQAASSNWRRSYVFAHRSSKRCGCCRNEPGPRRLDRGRCASRLGSPRYIPKIARRSMNPTKSHGFRF